MRGKMTLHKVFNGSMTMTVLYIRHISIKITQHITKLEKRVPSSRYFFFNYIIYFVNFIVFNCIFEPVSKNQK